MASTLYLVDPKGKKSPINPGWNVVGSASDCDIVVPGAEPHHLILHQAGDTLTLRAAATPKPADPLIPLTETEIRVAIVSRRSTSAATKKDASSNEPKTDEVILADTFSGDESPLKPEKTSLTLALPEKTFLNGKKATPGMTVSPGDRLRMNDVTLAVATDARSFVSRIWSRRLVRYPAYCAIAFVLLLIIGLLTIHILVDADAVGKIASGVLNNRTVTVNKLSYSVLGFDAEIEGLTVENLPEFGEKPFLVLERTRIDAPVFRAARFKPRVTVSSKIASVSLHRKMISGAWVWNFEKLTAPKEDEPSEPLEFPIKTPLSGLLLKADQTIGVIEFNDEKTQTRFKINNVLISVQQENIGLPVRFEMTGGIERETGGEQPFRLAAQTTYIDGSGAIDYRQIRDTGIETSVKGIPLSELMNFIAGELGGAPWDGQIINLDPNGENGLATIRLGKTSATFAQRRARANGEPLDDVVLRYCDDAEAVGTLKIDNAYPPKGTASFEFRLPKMLFPTDEKSVQALKDAAPLSASLGGQAMFDFSQPNGGQIDIEFNRRILTQAAGSDATVLCRQDGSLRITNIPFPADPFKIDVNELASKAHLLTVKSMNARTPERVYEQTIDLKAATQSHIGKAVSPALATIVETGALTLNVDFNADTLNAMTFGVEASGTMTGSGWALGTATGRANGKLELDLAPLIADALSGKLVAPPDAASPYAALIPITDAILGRAAFRGVELTALNANWTIPTGETYELLALKTCGLKRLERSAGFPSGAIDLSRFQLTGTGRVNLSSDVVDLLATMFAGMMDAAPFGSYFIADGSISGESLASLRFDFQSSQALNFASIKNRLPVNIANVPTLSADANAPISLSINLKKDRAVIDLSGQTLKLPVIDSLTASQASVSLGGETLIGSDGVQISNLDLGQLLEKPERAIFADIKINGKATINEKLVTSLLAYGDELLDAVVDLSPSAVNTAKRQIAEFKSQALFTLDGTLRFPYQLTGSLAATTENGVLTVSLDSAVLTPVSLRPKMPKGMIPLDFKARADINAELLDSGATLPIKLDARATEAALLERCELTARFDNLLERPYPSGYLRGEVRPKAAGLSALANQFGFGGFITPDAVIRGSVDINTDSSRKLEQIPPASVSLSGAVGGLPWLKLASFATNVNGLDKILFALGSTTAADPSQPINISAFLKDAKLDMTARLESFRPGALLNAAAASETLKAFIPPLLTNSVPKLTFTINGGVNGDGSLAFSNNALTGKGAWNCDDVRFSLIDSDDPSKPLIAFDGKRASSRGAIDATIRLSEKDVIIDAFNIETTQPGKTASISLTSEFPGALSATAVAVKPGAKVSEPFIIRKVNLLIKSAVDLEAMIRDTFPRLSSAGVTGTINTRVELKRDSVLLTPEGAEALIPDINVLVSNVGLKPESLAGKSALIDADLKINAESVSLKDGRAKFNFGTRAQTLTAQFAVRPSVGFKTLVEAFKAIETATASVLDITGELSGKDVLDINAIEEIIAASIKDGVAPYQSLAEKFAPKNLGEPSDTKNDEKPATPIKVFDALNALRFVGVNLTLDMAGIEYRLPLPEKNPKTTETTPKTPASPAPVAAVARLLTIKGNVINQPDGGRASLTLRPEYQAGDVIYSSGEPIALTADWLINVAARQFAFNGAFDLSRVKLKIQPRKDGPVYLDLAGDGQAIKATKTLTFAVTDNGGYQLESVATLDCPGVPGRLNASLTLDPGLQPLALDASLETPGDAVRLDQLAVIVPVLKNIQPTGNLFARLNATTSQFDTLPESLAINGELGCNALTFKSKSKPALGLSIDGQILITPETISMATPSLVLLSKIGDAPQTTSVGMKNLLIRNKDYQPDAAPSVRWLNDIASLPLTVTIETAGSDDILTLETFLDTVKALKKDLLGDTTDEKPAETATAPKTEPVSLMGLKQFTFDLKAVRFAGFSAFKFFIDQTTGHVRFADLKPDIVIQSDKGFYGGALRLKVDGDLSDGVDRLRIADIALDRFDVNRFFTECERFKRPDVASGTMSFTGEQVLSPALNFDYDKHIETDGVVGDFKINAEKVIILKPAECPGVSALYKNAEIVKLFGLDPNKPIPVSDGSTDVSLRKGRVSFDGPTISMVESPWKLTGYYVLKTGEYRAEMTVVTPSDKMVTIYRNAAEAYGEADRQLKSAGFDDATRKVFLDKRRAEADKSVAKAKILVTCASDKSIPSLKAAIAEDIAKLLSDTTTKVIEDIAKKKAKEEADKLKDKAKDAIGGKIKGLIK